MRLGTMICLSAACLLALAAGSGRAQTGYALEFDGVDDRVVASDPVDVTGPLTLEAWVRVDEFDGGRILSNRYGSDGYELDVSSTPLLRFTVDGNVRGDVDFSEHLGEWVHVAATWEGPGGGGVVMYVNGAPVATDSFTGTMTSATGDLMIGTSAWNPTSYPLHGAIDEIRIFDTVVSGETIAAWMTRRIDAGHPDWAHLRAAWSFEEGSGQVAAGAIGPDAQLGSDAAADAADPAWISSGMVAVSPRTWGRIKGLYRP